MTVQLYFLPTVKVPLGVEGNVYICPKYFPHRLNPAVGPMDGATWQWQTEALGDVALLAGDVTTEQHDFLVIQADVVALPADRRTAVTTRQRNDLIALGIPARVIGTTMQDTTAGMMRYWAVYNAIVGAVGARVAHSREIASGVTVADVAVALGADVQGEVSLKGERVL